MTKKKEIYSSSHGGYCNLIYTMLGLPTCVNNCDNKNASGLRVNKFYIFLQ